ncbi:MAG: alpha-L-rhamnosidase [Frankiales bacterium]|nr:alpha-L-rhamnosidase [Frankiales bacterium]
MTGERLPSAWVSRWIWAGQPVVDNGDPLATNALGPGARDRYCLFRGTFEFTDPVGTAWLRAAGDSRFKLYVNGTRVARGPVRSPPERQPSELVDVAEHLVPGKNVVAALVRFYGTAISTWIPAPLTLGLGGGCFGAELHLDDRCALVTDSRWKALVSEAWKPSAHETALAGFLPEDLDARRLAANWASPEFCDLHWPDAAVLDAGNLGSRDRQVMQTVPYGRLPARPVPALQGRTRTAVARRVYRIDRQGRCETALEQVAAGQQGALREIAVPGAGPVALQEAGGHLVCLDFGETVAGEVLLRFTGPAGTVIDLAFGEEARPDGTLRMSFAHHQLRYTARAGRQDFESFEPVGGRYAVVAVDAESECALEVAVHERLFPQLDTATFRCSDPDLDRIYETGLRTVALCSQDSYIDCPTREQRAWVGDAVVHQAVHLTTGSDWSLARWHMEMTDAPRSDGMLPMTVASNLGGLPGSATYIPDWALHWIRGLRNLMDYTGDRDLVARHLPTSERVLRWFEPFQGEDGLLKDVLGAVLVDWSNLPLEDTSAALNGLWARGLRDLEEMTTWVGDGARAAWARDRRHEVALGFEVFWDEQRGAYRDQRLNGTAVRRFSRHTNAAALTGGLVPPSRMPRVAEFLARRDHLVDDAPVPAALAAGDVELNARLLVRGNPEPTWDVEALVLEAQPFFRYVVHDALAEAGRADVITDLCRDWQTFLDRGETTWPEAWVGGTHCHGWSSTPTRDLIRYVLGISPGEPGFGTVQIEPALGDLHWAEAEIPHPAGRLTVRVDGDRLDVHSPVPVWVRTGSGPVHLAPGRHQLLL